MFLSVFSRKHIPGKMSFVDHLEALRGHLLRCVAAIAAGGIIVAVYNRFFIKEVLMGPLQPDFVTYGALCKLGRALHFKQLCMDGVNVQMQSTGVNTQFSMFFSVIIIGGLILAFPFIFYEFWKFIRPALTVEEKRKTRGVLFWVSLLFFLGVFFGYFVIAPYTVNFFANFKIDAAVENRWTVNSYIETLVPIILGAGLAFQLPLVMFFLSKIGIVSSAFLKAKRKYAIVIMLIVAGVITPPDVLSQVVVTLPLIALYEVSIVITKKIEKNKVATSVLLNS